MPKLTRRQFIQSAAIAAAYHGALPSMVKRMARAKEVTTKPLLTIPLAIGAPVVPDFRLWRRVYLPVVTKGVLR